MDKSVKKLSAHTFIGDFGQTVSEFSLECSGKIPALAPENFTITGARKDISGKRPPSGITNLRTEKNKLILEVDPFIYKGDFSISGEGGAKKFSFTASDVTEVTTRTADDFAAMEEDGVLYRLHTPDLAGPRPLVLYLHGGGESGFDNFIQLTGTMGAVNLAERWPDKYIMAPQAPGGALGSAELARMMGPGGAFDMSIGKLPEISSRGWHRMYLAKICKIIRNMIAEGKVDEKRVYITGLSMGGAGTLRTLSVDPTLFAAAAPVCPSMNGETYMILSNIRNTAIWVSAAYIDHQPARHAYLTRAYQKLLEDGFVEARLTIYTPEDLAQYGIGSDPTLTHRELLSENHSCWTLTYHNEYGILDWLISVVKD